MRARSIEAGQVFSVAGLPLSTAIVYASLFTIAFWLYATLWQNAPVVAPDSDGYLRAAKDLADLHMDQLQPRPPGYPILMALTHSIKSPSRSLFFVSLLLQFASIWLLASVLYRARVGGAMLIVFALILLLPPYMESAAYVLSDNLAQFMIVIGFATFVYWILNRGIQWSLLSGIAFGYAALTRPTFQILIVAIGAYFIIAIFVLRWTAFSWKEGLKGMLVVSGGFFVIVAGYASLNYRNFGYF